MSKYYDIETEVNDIDEISQQLSQQKSRVELLIAGYLTSKNIHVTQVHDYYMANDEYLEISYNIGFERTRKQFEIADINQFIENIKD